VSACACMCAQAAHTRGSPCACRRDRLCAAALPLCFALCMRSTGVYLGAQRRAPRYSLRSAAVAAALPCAENTCSTRRSICGGTGSTVSVPSGSPPCALVFALLLLLLLHRPSVLLCAAHAPPCCAALTRSSQELLQLRGGLDHLGAQWQPPCAPVLPLLRCAAAVLTCTQALLNLRRCPLCFCFLRWPTQPLPAPPCACAALVAAQRSPLLRRPCVVLCCALAMQALLRCCCAAAALPLCFALSMQQGLRCAALHLTRSTVAPRSAPGSA
jgi:hypothetical protein